MPDRISRMRSLARMPLRMSLRMALGMAMMLAAIAAAPQDGGGWGPEEIRKAARAYLESLPTSKMEVEGITLEYRRIPGDPREVARAVPDGRLREVIRALPETLRQHLHSFLEEAATLETERTVTYERKGESTVIPPGEYDLGIYLMEGVPRTIGIAGKGLDEPLRIPVKVRKKIAEPQTLLVAGKLKKDRLRVSMAYGAHVFQAPDLLVGEMPVEDPPGGPPGGGEEGAGDDGKGEEAGASGS